VGGAYHHRRHGWGLREARVWSVREAGRGKRSERRERVLLFLEVSGGAATPSHHSPTGRCWPNGPTSVSKKKVPLEFSPWPVIFILIFEVCNETRSKQILIL